MWFRLREIPTSSVLTGKDEFGYYVFVVASVRSSIWALPYLYRDVIPFFYSNPLCRIAGPRVILIKWEHGMTVEQSKKL